MARPSGSRFAAVLAAVSSSTFVLPAHPDDETLACAALEAIVAHRDPICATLPEVDHLRHPRPHDTEPAWPRMGDPLRCRTRAGVEITMWPWLDLTTGHEYVEILVVHVAKRACFVSPALRAYYRDKVRSGFFGHPRAARMPPKEPQPKPTRGRTRPKR